MSHMRHLTDDPETTANLARDQHVHPSHPPHLDPTKRLFYQRQRSAGRGRLPCGRLAGAGGHSMWGSGRPDVCFDARSFGYICAREGVGAGKDTDRGCAILGALGSASELAGCVWTHDVTLLILLWLLLCVFCLPYCIIKCPVVPCLGHMKLPAAALLR